MSRNRIQDRIQLLNARITGGEIPQADLDRLEESLKTDTSDLIQYQNVQAFAHASGKITFAEADMAYNLLGREAPSEEKWNKLSLAERVALTQLMSELLDWQVQLQPGWHARTIPTGGSRRPKRETGKSSPGSGIQEVGG